MISEKFLNIRIIPRKKGGEDVNIFLFSSNTLHSLIEMIKQINEKDLASHWLILILQRQEAEMPPES